MEVTIQMTFSPESLKVDPQDVKAAMALKKTGTNNSQFREAMHRILSGTPLSRMKVSTTANHSGNVTLSNDMKDGSIIFATKEQLTLDTINQFVRITDRDKKYHPKTIILTCTITESSLPQRKLSRGFYNKPNQNIFGRVLNAPTAKDKSRVKITLYGQSIHAVKQAFVEMLDGTWRTHNA